MSRYGFWIVVLSSAAIALAVGALGCGAVSVDYATVLRILLRRLGGIGSADWSPVTDRIVADLRAPRVVLALLVGAGLAASGVVLQAVTRNVLADPYLFGLSSGASFGVVLGLAAFGGRLPVPLCAFVGGIAASALVLGVGLRGKSETPERMILSGVAVAFLLSAATNLTIYLSGREAAQSALFWMLGSLGGARWSNLAAPALALLPCIAWTVARGPALDALAMGEETATTLGIDVRRLRFVGLLVASLATAVLVAASGAIGFVGLVLPHVARRLVGGGHRRLLPVAALLGAGFLICADTAARSVVVPAELPVGIVTAALGGSYFLWLLGRR